MITSNTHINFVLTSEDYHLKDIESFNSPTLDGYLFILKFRSLIYLSKFYCNHYIEFLHLLSYLSLKFSFS